MDRQRAVQHDLAVDADLVLGVAQTSESAPRTRAAIRIVEAIVKMPAMTIRVSEMGRVSRIEKSPLDQLIVTNSVPLREDGQRCKKIVVLPVGRLLGQAIRNIHEETSVSSLFV